MDVHFEKQTCISYLDYTYKFCEDKKNFKENLYTFLNFSKIKNVF